MEECVSASGTPTSATARQVTEAKTVNKVGNVPLIDVQSQRVCVCFPSYEPKASQDIMLKIKWDMEMPLMIHCESPSTHHEVPVASGLEIQDKSKL